VAIDNRSDRPTIHNIWRHRSVVGFGLKNAYSLVAVPKGLNLQPFIVPRTAAITVVAVKTVLKVSAF
jgi:hypothetical protein